MSDAGQAESGSAGTTPAEGEIRLRVFGRTDVGQIREHNEDNLVVANLTQATRSLKEEDRHQAVGERGTALVVCDGMGGAAAGEVASQMAVDIIFEKLTEGAGPVSPDDLARKLVHAVEEAGSRIFEEARIDRTRRGMGTTSTVAALVSARLFLAQVGDSRAYLLRDGKLTQLTRDQSLVNQLIEAGQLTEEEAETFEHNNIILQALGTSETVQVDLTYCDLQEGDTVLLCSDGLSGMIRAEEIREVLAAVDDPIEACKHLTDRANGAGGHDNVTVIVAHFTGPGLPRQGQVEAAGYRKYALPEQLNPDATTRAAPLSGQAPASAPAASGDTGGGDKLRVGHTMIGSAPLITQETPGGDQSGPAPAPGPRGADDPVDIPTSGLPPALIGVMVVGCLLVAGVIGLALFLRGG